MLAEEICKRGLKLCLRGQIRADRVNPRRMESLKKCGFFQFAVGFENFAGSALRRIAKYADVETNHYSMGTLLELGYLVQAGFILFDKATSLEELCINFDALNKYRTAVFRGIYSEMFAAPATSFTRSLQRRQMISFSSNGNATYLVEDPMAETIRESLRRWQKEYGTLADRITDPISSPKALCAAEMKECHSVYLEMRDKGLDFFGKLLEIACEASSVRVFERQAYDLTSVCLEESKDFREYLDDKIRRVYRDFDIRYQGGGNVFL